MRQRVLIGAVLAFLSCISTGLFAQAVITVSVPSGSYSRDQRVMLESGDEVELYYSFAESRDARFVPYLFPFSLSALEGEERLYTLRVEARSKGETVKKKEFTYLIDKRAPGEPKVNIPGGTYGNQISIQFEPPPEGTENGDPESATQIFYCLNGSIQDDAVLWNGESIYLPSDADRVLTHTIKTYARDLAGNLSELRVWSYTIDTLEELPEAGLRILSPVPGVFGNRQHLVIRSSGYEWIRYTFGGDDPEDVGTSYAGPLLVDLAGTVLLRVSGKLSSTGEIRTARIEYTVNEPNVDFYQLEGGVYDEARQIQLDDRATTYYSLDDTSASRKALQYENPFKIDLVENGLKYIPLRIIREEHIQTGIAEFRYFYVLDDRTPSKPEIILDQTPPVREDTNVSISGPADASIYYTIDGTSPDVLAMEYSGPFTLDLPEESEAGSLLVKAAAFGSNGRRSENSLVLVTFDRIPPAKPEISYLDKNKTAGITIGVKGEFGSKIVYEMTLDDSLPGIPDTASLRSDDFIDLDVPYGMERMFAFRFAAMDGAGNLSEASATFRVLVDKVPPDPPTVTMQEGKIVVQGDDTLYYTITTDGSEPPLPDERATEYIEPIALDFEDGMLNEVKIKAVAVDKSGNASRISDTYPVLADLREPYLPDFDGITDGGVYNSSRTLTLRGMDDAVQVFYSYSINGEEPADPDSDSDLLGDSLVFTGIDDSETDYIIKLLPILSNGTITGDIRTISFTIDLVGPEIPVIRGVSNGKTYNRGVFVLPPLGIGDDVFLAISENDGPLDPFDGNAIRFVSPYRLDVPEGSEKTFKLAIGAKDRADNRALNPEIYTVIIDRNPPSRPVLTGLPPGGIARNGVELAIASNYPTYYEISTDGTLPSLPTVASKKYEQTLLVNGEAGREVLYTVRFLAFDEVGNGSSQSVARFTIDLKEPEKLSSPQVSFAGDSSISVSWTGVIEDMIYYSMDGLDQETFTVYEGPFTIPYDESRETIELKYYSRDRAGNQSELGTLNLTLAGQTGDSLFSGIADGLVYNSRQVISRNRNNEGVRYEVTTNGPIPSNTSPFSPAMPEILSFDAAPGETLRYAVRAAVFDGNDSTPIQEQIVRFTIDKTPPPPPDIPDWNDEMFFQDDFQVALETAEGAVYVSINESSYAKYTSPLLLQSVSGGIDTYRISAYTKDEAGNQSAQIKEWLAHIDRQVIYVSTKGNDLYDGSRSKPFRTISTAVREAGTSERKTIYLAEGIYRLSEQINLTGDLTLIGGFAGNSWKDTASNLSTTLMISEEFLTGEAAVSVMPGAKLSLQNLALKSLSGVIGGPFLSQSGGSAAIVNCTFEADTAGPSPTLEFTGGDLVTEQLDIYVANFSGDKFVLAKGKSLKIARSVFSYENSVSDVALFSIDGIESALISDSVFEPGNGRRTYGLEIISSVVEINNSKVHTGVGKTKATGVYISESELFSDGLVLVGNREAWIATCLEAEFSTVNIRNARIDAFADRGVVAVQTEGTELDLRSSRIRGLAGSEFIYLAKLSNTRGTLTGNMFTGSKTRDFIGIHSQNSTLGLINNTIIAGPGSNVTAGITLFGNEESKLVNNILYGPESLGTAISIDGPGRGLRILNNALDGWGSYFKTTVGLSSTLIDLEEADLAREGGRISGNFLEDKELTFVADDDGVFRLSPSSKSVDAGFNPILLNETIRADYDGDIRQDPFDVGADEIR